MFYAVIMAGDRGAPVAVEPPGTPKQELKLVGDAPMFQLAVERLDPLFPPDRIFIVTRANHASALIAQAPQIPAAIS